MSIRNQFDDSVPFKIDGVYCKLIPLTMGMYAIVDAVDYKWLSKFNWCTQKKNKSGEFYASRNGSQARGVKKTRIMMHRQVLKLDAVLEVDHIGGFGSLDNRRANLRPATHIQNQYNRKIGIVNTSGYKGVSWDASRGLWIAYIAANRKRRTLGRFPTAEAAYVAYCSAAKQLHGEFARTA